MAVEINRIKKVHMTRLHFLIKSVNNAHEFLNDSQQRTLLFQ